jgi:hypothetical protein
MAGAPPAAIVGAAGDSERDLSASALSVEAHESAVATDSGAFLGGLWDWGSCVHFGGNGDL